MDFVSLFDKTAGTFGLFAAMFIFLLAWVLYTNNEREKRYIAREDKYMQLVEQFADSFSNMESDIQQIKNKLWS